MQVQNNLKKYELYSNRSSGTQISRLRERRSGKKLLVSLLILLSVVLLVATVIAANIAFDNTVMAATPDYSLNSPEYSSYNSVFSGFKPTVTFSVIDRGGDKLILSTESVELGEILEDKDIVLDDTCVVNHSLDTVVYDGMEVIIDSITYEEVVVDSVIPYETTTIELQTIPKGTKKVITKGAEGALSSTYKKKYINGVYDSEELVAQVTSLDPVTEVVEVGVGGTFVGKDGKTYSYSYYVDVQATCYGKADGSGDITFCGTPARVGVIAVDPRVIPLWSTCYVTGPYKDIGVVSAEDTGSAIKGNIIDVYMEGTLEDLFAFGRRNMRVYVLEK